MCQTGHYLTHKITACYITFVRDLRQIQLLYFFAYYKAIFQTHITIKVYALNISCFAHS
jgi:hypothetical protein